MELTIKAALFHKLDNIETFFIKVSEDNSKLIKKRILLERGKMIEYLKDLKNNNKINSIFNPIDINILKPVKRGDRMTNVRQKTDTPFQKDLNRLVFIKKELKKSLNSINEFYM